MRRHWVTSGASSKFQPVEPSSVEYDGSKELHYDRDHDRDLVDDDYDPSGCTYQKGVCLYEKESDKVDSGCKLDQVAKTCTKQETGCQYFPILDQCRQNLTGRTDPRCERSATGRCSVKPVGCRVNIVDDCVIDKDSVHVDPSCKLWRLSGATPMCRKIERLGCRYQPLSKKCAISLLNNRVDDKCDKSATGDCTVKSESESESESVVEEPDY